MLPMRGMICIGGVRRWMSSAYGRYDCDRGVTSHHHAQHDETMNGLGTC